MKMTFDELCITYIRFVYTAGDGYMRVKLHDEIENRLGIEVGDILHNLDKSIGFNPDMNYDAEDLDKLGKKLSTILKRRAKNEANLH